MTTEEAIKERDAIRAAEVEPECMTCDGTEWDLFAGYKICKTCGRQVSTIKARKKAEDDERQSDLLPLFA